MFLNRHKRIRCVLVILLGIVLVHESSWWLYERYKCHKANELQRYVVPLGGCINSGRSRLLLTDSKKVKGNASELVSVIRRTIPIKRLYLSGSDVDDTSLKLFVENLPGLDGLYVGRTQITDDGLKELWKASDLCSFHARNTDISDAGVQYITGCKKLFDLSLTGKKITDDSAIMISTLPKLTTLTLDNTSITDKGLSYLARMNNLEELSLEGANISDEGIKKLKDTKLKYINARGTAVTIKRVGDTEIGVGLVVPVDDPEYE